MGGGGCIGTTYHVFGVLVGCGWVGVRGSLEPPMFGVCSSWMGVCEHVSLCVCVCAVDLLCLVLQLGVLFARLCLMLQLNDFLAYSLRCC